MVLTPSMVMPAATCGRPLLFPLTLIMPLDRLRAHEDG
jgi:hypothetical protein